MNNITPNPVPSQEKPVKPKRIPHDREALRHRTREENSRIYNRRWPKATKAIREELNTLYPGRNSFTYNPAWSITSSNNASSPCTPKKNNIIYISANVEVARRCAKAFENVSQGQIDTLRSPFSQRSPSSFFKYQSPVPVQDFWTVLEKEKKKEPVMQAKPIRQSVCNLTMLNLSKWGQIKLSAYPDQALDYAYSQLKFTNPRDPFKWFVSLCMRYCQENKMAPDWSGMLTLSRELNMPDNAAMTLGPLLKPIEKAPETGKAKSVPSVYINAAIVNRAERLFRDEVPKRGRSQFYVKRNLEQCARDFPQCRDQFDAYWASDVSGDIRTWLNDPNWHPYTFDYTAHRNALLAQEAINPEETRQKLYAELAKPEYAKGRAIVESIISQPYISKPVTSPVTADKSLDATSNEELLSWQPQETDAIDDDNMFEEIFV